MNVKLAMDVEITTYYNLLEGEGNQLESGIQNMSIHTKTTSDYSGGLSPAYGNLSYGLGFQTNLGSWGLLLLQQHQHQFLQESACEED